MDIDKAEHFNRIYLSKRDPKELVGLLPPNRFGYSDIALENIARAATERSSFTKDIAGAVSYFFEDVDVPVDKLKKSNEFNSFLNAVISRTNSDNWDPEALCNTFFSTIEELGIHRGSALNNLRLCITGGASGPKMHEMMEMMGKDEFLRRLKKAEDSLAPAL